MKGGAALEQLADGRILLFDKTGTLTAGRPEVIHVLTAPDIDEAHVIGLAASLEQVSPHVVATAVVRRGPGRHRGAPARFGHRGPWVRYRGRGRRPRGAGRQSAVDSGRAEAGLGSPGSAARGSGPVVDRFRGSR